MWEEEYKDHLRDIGVLGMRSDLNCQIVTRIDNEIGKLKKLAEKIIFLLVINVVVMICILIVIMCK